MVYLITYDLRQPGRDYQSLYDAIKNVGTDYIHSLESVWFVKTSKSSKAVYEQLSSYIDKNDYLVIFEVNSNHYGVAPKGLWDWLSKALSS